MCNAIVKSTHSFKAAKKSFQMVLQMKFNPYFEQLTIKFTENIIK